MKDKLTYNGNEITAAPLLQEDGTWLTNFSIKKEGDPSRSSRYYDLPMKCHQRIEATQWCHQAARDIIDGVQF